jgi:PAS domain S-box-containing protein
MKESLPLPKQFVLLSKLLLISIIVVAVLVLTSWYLFVEIFPGALRVNPVTASLFIFTALSFLLLIEEQKNAWLRKLAYSLLTIVVVVSTYAFIDRFIHFSFHIDQVLFGTSLVKKAPFRLPIDMAATAAVCFVLGVVAIRFIHSSGKVIVSQTIALVIFTIATYTIVGYLYHVPEIKSLFLMSVVSAVLFYCFVLAILFSRPNEGMMNQILAANTGGVTARILIPVTIVLPILFGYVRVWSHWLNAVSVELGIAMLVISITILYLVSVWKVSTILSKRDQEKEKDKNDLLRLNEELKNTNAKLDTTNKDLQTLNEELLTSLEELTSSNEQLDVANQTIAKQKDERLNQVLDNINDVIWSFDLTGEGDNYLSRSAERIFDEPYEKLVNEPYFWSKYIHPDDRPIKNESQKRLQKEGATECTYRIVTHNGTRWIHDRLRIVKDDKGNQVRLEGIASDVTSLKETERQLNRYRENLEIIFENTTDFFLLLDHQAKAIAFNKPFWNYAAENLGVELKIGDHFTSVLPPNRTATGMELFRRAWSGETIRTISETIFENHVKYFNVRYAPVVRNGQVLYVSISSTDITEQRKQEIISNRYKENLDIIFENSTDIFVLIDAQSNLVLFNKAFVRYAQQLRNIQPTEGMPLEELAAPNRREATREILAQVMKGEKVSVVSESVFPSGTRYYEAHYSPVFNREGLITHITLSSTDVTELRRQEQALSEYRKNLDIIFRNTKDNFLLVSAEGKVILFNYSFGRFVKETIGTEAAIGMDFLEVVAPQRRDVARKIFQEVRQGKPFATDAEIDSPSGEKIYHYLRYEPVLQQGIVTHVCISAVDITDFRKIENQLKEDQFFLDKASESAKIVYWTCEPDFVNGKVLWCKEVFKIHDLEAKDFIGQVNLFYQLAHPEDRQMLAEAAHRSLVDKEPLNVDHRIVLKDGSIRWVNQNAHIIYDSAGRPEIMVGITQDITDRKNTEFELKQNQYFLEKASEAAQMGYWTSASGTPGRLTWSKGVYEIFEVSEEEFDGTNQFFFDRVHPDDLTMVVEHMNMAIRENKVYDIDHRIVLKNGRIKWVNERAQVLVNKEDKTTALVVGIVQDIDQWKKMEEVLREYNDRFEILSRATNDVIWDWDIEKDYIFYNHGIQTVLGYGHKEIKPNKDWWRERFHPDDSPRINRELEVSFELKKKRWESYYRYRASDGTYKNIHDRASIVYNEAGNPIRVIGAMQDVTEQTRQTEEIASLFENANVPIIAFDRDFNIVEWNPASAQTLGFLEEEVIGQNVLDDLLPPDNVHRFKHMLSMVLEGHAVSNFEMQVIAKDKSHMILLVSASPRKMRHDQVQEAVVVAQNITELTDYRQRLEKIIEKRTQELNDALSKEKNAVEMQKRFVSMASHEFRTPLSSISLASGYIRKFRKKLTSEKIEEKLLGIETQIRHMTYLLDNVLMVGKSESGKIPVMLSILDTKLTFATLAQEVMASTRNSHWIELKMSCTKTHFVCDEGLLRNIVINLLNNAIKFSPGAEVVNFTVSCNEEKLIMVVKDHGMGIPREDMDRLFEPFYRATNTKAISGTGLGLSIVKKAVELLNGQLSVKSELGKGTEFTITLPHSNETPTR